MNAYALLVAAAPDAFDLVSVQLYEGWSRADQALLEPTARSAPPRAANANETMTVAAAYLRGWAAAVTAGWTVDFGAGVPGLPTVGGATAVRLPSAKLVVALSRGSSSGSGKSAFFWPSDAAAAYRAAPPAERPRGYAFWNIPSEGNTVNGTNATLAFAPELNAFLGVRPSAAVV